MPGNQYVRRKNKEKGCEEKSVLGSPFPCHQDNHQMIGLLTVSLPFDKRYKKPFNNTLTPSYSKNVSRDSPWNFIPRLLVIGMKIGNQNFKIAWTGSEPEIQNFLRVNRSRMTLRITSKKMDRLHTVHS